MSSSVIISALLVVIFIMMIYILGMYSYYRQEIELAKLRSWFMGKGFMYKGVEWRCVNAEPYVDSGQGNDKTSTVLLTLKSLDGLTVTVGNKDVNLREI